MTTPRRSRLLRLLSAFCITLVFVAATLAALALHLGLPPGRRVVARSLVSVLDATFLGRFELSGLRELTASTLLVERFVVREPGGRVVLEAGGVRVKASLTTIVREVLEADAKTTLVIEHTRVESVRVLLAPAANSSELGLVRAFTPRSTTPSTTPPPRVWLGSIELGRGNVHAELLGLPKLDGEVTGAKGQVLVSAVGVAVDAARFSAVVRGLLPKELRAVGSFHQRGTTHFWSTLDGYAGDLQFDSVARLDGRRLAVTLDLPRGEPAVVRTLLPEWPLEQVATLRVEAQGDLPKLDLVARGTLGDATLDAKGVLELSPEVRLKLAAQGTDFDLRSLFPDAPQTRLAAKGTLDLLSNERGVELTTDGASEATEIAGVPLPSSEFHARYAEPEGLTGRATLREVGMPLDATFSLKAGGVFDADVHAPRFQLEKAPRLARLLKTRGTAELHAKAHLARDQLTATLSADVERFAVGALELGRAHVAARAAGPVSTPKDLRIDGTVEGNRARFGELAFDDVSARVSGPLARLAISTKLAGQHGASVEASTKLAALGGTRFDDVDIVVARDGQSLHARARRVELVGESIELSEVGLEGAGGTLTGSGRYRPGLLEIDARGHALDLAALGHVLGVSRGRARGKLDLTAELAIARDVRRGSLTLAVRDGAYESLSGVTLDLATTLSGDDIEGNAVLAVAELGRLRSSFDTHVQGSLWDASAWRRATGRWDIGLERLELPAVRRFLPAALGVSELEGGLVAQVTVIRDQPEQVPNVTLLAATDRLALTHVSEEGAVPIELSGIEAQVSGSVDSQQGIAQADVRLVDEHGLLLSGSGKLDVEVERLLASPRDAWALIRREPIVATLVVEGRPLDQLPAPFRPKDVAGILRAEVGLRGSFAEPRLSAKAALRSLAIGDSTAVVPFDVCGALQYDPLAQRLGLGVQAHLTGAASLACAGRRVAVGSAQGIIDPQAFARGERGFRGEAQLGFEDLPLELVPALTASGMVGSVRGVAALTDAGELPALNARLRLSDVAVRGIPVGSGDLSLRSDGRALRAGVKLERAGGTLDAEGRAGVAWDQSVPALDREQPLTLTASIHDIDAAILSPIVGDVLADLSGRLEGAVAVTLAPLGAKRGAKPMVSELSGKLSLQNGAFQLAGLGMRLSKVKFDAETRRSGEHTVISVRGLSAASGGKSENVSASADVYLSGLSLYDARANVNLRGVPLMIEGVSQATLTGAATLELFPQRDPMLVAIQLHDLSAALPFSSGRAVLSVEDNPNISVKQPLREPVRVARGGALRWQLAFDLLRKVKISRSDLEIPLRGRPVVDIGEETNVSGDLELEAGGRVQLLGKGFLIESGEVHFDTEDPSDPHLRVLASWRAPDGTVVYVEVGGTVRHASLRLESDPALSQAEIQALLLGGGSSEGGGEAQAAGLGYGADFVGQLLADTPLKRVELRTANETTADDLSYSTYTAAVPISENVWVELSYKSLETSGPAEHSDAASATVDWRFKRDWSLRTEAGTIGTGLDLLWQYRY